MSKASPSVENFNDDDPDAFPRPFGSYLLLQRFARGGMGEVYLGKFGAIAGLERYCVLKKLRAELTRDREYVTRFIDEARVVVTLNHANICHVFDVGRVGDEYYLAMEYISGRDIRTVQDRCRQRERTIPAATALHLVCEVLEALDYAHRRNHPITGEPLNLVHRDVSPQNVLVSFEGEVKLIDFGLAASKLKVERTQPNVVMGKMAYMAPEQARGDPIDSRADLFACGVLGYELLAGERFYEGMSANDIWQVAGRGSFVPPKWQALDPEVAKILAKALHPDPKKRFATCGDFREALASHLHWRFPGTGVRGVRDVIAELFADEIRKERELMSRFGRVTVASFRTTFENTQSQSVSLARAGDDVSTAHQSTRLMRDEKSSSAPGGPMPPPGSRDLHQDPTRLTTDPQKLLAPEDTASHTREQGSTDEQSTQARASAPGPTAPSVAEPPASTRPQAEATQRVSRPQGTAKTRSRPVVKSFDLEAVTSSTVPKSRAPTLIAAGLGALVVAGVIALVAVDWGGEAEAAEAPPSAAPSAPAAAATVSPVAEPPPAAPPMASPEPPPTPPAPPPAPEPVVAPPPDFPVEALSADAAREQRALEQRRADRAARERKEAERAKELEREQRAKADEQARQADEARRKAKEEAERKKEEAAAAPKTPEELAQICGGRCDQELNNWRRKKGDLAFRTALEACVKIKKCK
ncbi:MAG: protein kinase [Deltaproteobacteria bacterium]|nr:protein kinase [Deltaproteobacteria bacterium]